MERTTRNRPRPGAETKRPGGGEVRLALLGSIIDSSDDAIVSKTLDGVVTSWNPAAETIYGYQADEIIGKPFSILVHKDRPDEMVNVLLDETYAKSHAAVQPGPHVMLALSDTGSGMDEATRQRVFEPFFTTKASGKGTGLGLSTAYGIIKQSGGDIWAYSELGIGTTFKIYLPQVEEAPREDRPVVVVAAARGTECILIVEDEESLRGVARRILESAGYTVLVAGTGAEALRLLERHLGRVHLLLTDVVMPGMSGRDLAKRLEVSNPEMRILYTSGYSDDAIASNGMLDEGVHFIGKPYTIAELTHKVREVLDS